MFFKVFKEFWEGWISSSMWMSLSCSFSVHLPHIFPLLGSTLVCTVLETKETAPPGFPYKVHSCNKSPGTLAQFCHATCLISTTTEGAQSRNAITRSRTFQFLFFTSNSGRGRQKSGKFEAFLSDHSVWGCQDFCYRSVLIPKRWPLATETSEKSRDISDGTVQFDMEIHIIENQVTENTLGIPSTRALKNAAKTVSLYGISAWQPYFCMATVFLHGNHIFAWQPYLLAGWQFYMIC